MTGVPVALIIGDALLQVTAELPLSEQLVMKRFLRQLISEPQSPRVALFSIRTALRYAVFSLSPLQEIRPCLDTLWWK